MAAQGLRCFPIVDVVESEQELNKPLLNTKDGHKEHSHHRALDGARGLNKPLASVATPEVRVLGADNYAWAGCKLSLPGKGIQLPDPAETWGAQKRQMETWLAVAIVELLILFPFMLAVPGVVVLVFPPIVVGAVAATHYLSHHQAPANQVKSVRRVMSLSMAACLLNLIPLAILGFGLVFFVFACPGLEDPVGECWSTAVYFGLSEVVAGWYSWLSFVIGSHARTVSIMMDPVSAGFVRIV